MEIVIITTLPVSCSCFVSLSRSTIIIYVILIKWYCYIVNYSFFKYVHDQCHSMSVPWLAVVLFPRCLNCMIWFDVWLGLIVAAIVNWLLSFGSCHYYFWCRCSCGYLLEFADTIKLLVSFGSCWWMPLSIDDCSCQYDYFSLVTGTTVGFYLIAAVFC